MTNPSRAFTWTNSGLDRRYSLSAFTGLASMTRASRPSDWCSRTWVGVVASLQVSM